MKIFISYPRKLIEKAELLSGRLYNMRQRHFIDHEIDPGKSWDKEIKEKIQEHDIYIILFENSDLDPNGYYCNRSDPCDHTTGTAGKSGTSFPTRRA